MKYTWTWLLSLKEPPVQWTSLSARNRPLFFRLFLFFLFSKFLSLSLFVLLFFLLFFFSASFYFCPNFILFCSFCFSCSYVLLAFFVFVMFSSFPVPFLGLVLLVVVLLLMSLFFQIFFVLLFFLLLVYSSLFILIQYKCLLRSLTDWGLKCCISRLVCGTQPSTCRSQSATRPTPSTASTWMATAETPVTGSTSAFICTRTEWVSPHTTTTTICTMPTAPSDGWAVGGTTIVVLGLVEALVLVLQRWSWLHHCSFVMHSIVKWFKHPWSWPRTPLALVLALNKPGLGLGLEHPWCDLRTHPCLECGGLGYTIVHNDCYSFCLTCGWQYYGKLPTSETKTLSVSRLMIKPRQ